MKLSDICYARHKLGMHDIKSARRRGVNLRPFVDGEFTEVSRRGKTINFGTTKTRQHHQRRIVARCRELRSDPTDQDLYIKDASLEIDLRRGHRTILDEVQSSELRPPIEPTEAYYPSTCPSQRK